MRNTSRFIECLTSECIVWKRLSARQCRSRAGLGYRVRWNRVTITRRGVLFRNSNRRVSSIEWARNDNSWANNPFRRSIVATRVLFPTPQHFTMSFISHGATDELLQIAKNESKYMIPICKSYIFSRSPISALSRPLKKCWGGVMKWNEISDHTRV